MADKRRELTIGEMAQMYVDALFALYGSRIENNQRKSDDGSGR